MADSHPGCVQASISCFDGWYEGGADAQPKWKTGPNPEDVAKKAHSDRPSAFGL